MQENRQLKDFIQQEDSRYKYLINKLGEEKEQLRWSERQLKNVVKHQNQINKAAQAQQTQQDCRFRVFGCICICDKFCVFVWLIFYTVYTYNYYVAVWKIHVFYFVLWTTTLTQFVMLLPPGFKQHLCAVFPVHNHNRFSTAIASIIDTLLPMPRVEYLCFNVYDSYCK